MNKLIKRRVPTYFSGFLLGLAAVLLIMQVKKAVAPEFPDLNEKRAPLQIAAGGSVRLSLGAEPGKYLAWGFPTRLAIGLRKDNGRVEPVLTLEYKNLVEPETLLGPLNEAGAYDLVAHFYVCSQPGEKYCTKIVIEQLIQAFSGKEAPGEALLSVDLKSAAENAAEKGKNQALPIPK